MSILLDTNVLSEVLRSAPSASVLSWLSAQSPESLFVSAVTQAEMALGAGLLPVGKRRDALQRALAALFEQDFAGRVLPFDGGAVPFYVDVVVRRRSAGRPMSQFDAQIAAIARHHGATVATRNIADFEGCGLTLVDPWE
jgi:predicted nucleic acid-binding protein